MTLVPTPARLGALLCSTFCFAATAGADTSAGLPDVAQIEDIDQLTTFADTAMTILMHDHRVPAAAVSIVKGDRILLTRGYGYADLEQRKPATAETLFRVGSISKLFTWTAVMQLRERGALDLDRDVNDYLRDWKIPDTYAEPITLRHLMTHTPGFEESFLGFLDHSIPNPSKEISSQDLVPLEEYLRAHIPARVRPPGEMSSYSNYGAALAGLIVQNASGVPYARFVRASIFEPLAMRTATFEEPLPSTAAAAIGYARNLGVFEAQPFDFIGSMAPAGAASASAADMANFMIAHLRDGRFGDQRILSVPGAQAMRAPAFELHPKLPAMALGFYEQTYNGETVVGHGGDTEDFHCELLLTRDGVGLFVAFVGEGGGRARGEFIQAFFDRHYPLAPAAKAARSQQTPAAIEDYAGSYLLTRRNRSTIEKAFSVLGSGVRVAALPAGRLIVAGMGEEPLQFERVDEDLFAQIDGTQRIGFKRDGDGRVSHLFVDNLPFMPTERVSAFQAPATWHLVLLVAFVLFLSVLLGLRYRWQEVRGMPAGPRRAVHVAAATAGCAWFIVATFAIMAAVLKEQMILRISTAFEIALVLPVVFVLLTALLINYAVKVWKERYWSTARRIHYTAVTAAAIALCAFFIQWRILGWQLP